MKQALILIAGRGSRLRDVNKGLPKSLMQFGDTHLLNIQILSLLEAGMTRIICVVGFKKDVIKRHIRSAFPEQYNTFIFVENRRWRSTNVLGSLFCARIYLNLDTVILHGDTLYPPALMRKLTRAPVTSARLVVQKKTVADEEMKYITDGHETILCLSKKIDPLLAEGEFMGISYISARFARNLRRILERERFSTIRNHYYEWGLTMVALVEGMSLEAYDASKDPMIEIDFPEDYERARTKLYPLIAARSVPTKRGRSRD